MSHNLRGRASAQLETFSGTVTLAQPHDLPEGASPRNENMDFSVGSVFTRQGLENPFTYSGGSVGPVPGSSAVDTSFGGAVWTNPGNTLLNTGVYAETSITGGLSISSIEVLSLVRPGNLQVHEFLYVTVVTFTKDTPSVTDGMTYSFSGVTNYTSLNGQTLTPYSSISWGFNTVTPDANQAIFEFGSSGMSEEPDTGIGLYTGASDSTDAIDITHFGLSLASSNTPQGFQISIPAYSSSAATLSVQMLKDGSSVGNTESIALNVGSVTTLSFGGANDLFGGSWSYSDLNNTSFGIRITATSYTPSTIYVGYTTVSVNFVPSQMNYNYVTTFDDSFGNIKNLALSANGDWFYEDVTNNPGVLVSLFTGMPAGSFASSFTADSRQFVAISDLRQGNYPPQGYNGTWHDRVSQVGPGGAPSFASTLTSGETSALTAYSYANGVLTLTGPNSFTAGEVVSIVAASTDPLYALNGVSFNILGTGLSSTGFEVSTTRISGSGTTTASAVPEYTYPVSSIDQNLSRPLDQSQLDDILWSAGPGSKSSGYTVTVYYSQGEEDTTLDQTFASDLYSVYVYVSGTNMAIANGTHLVTSTGKGVPPGGSGHRWYFTFTVASSSYSNLGGGANAQPGRYQMTIATVITSLPLPGVTTNDSITVTGGPVVSWDQTWKVLNTPNSGSYSIGQTVATADGLATYSWQISGLTAVPPAAGQLVTVTGTTNNNGALNVTDAVISSVTGTSSGTFTISGFTGLIAETVTESDSQAVTSGTKFMIDPGPLTLGEPITDSPIYGNSGGGYITLVGSSSVVIGTGTRKGTVFFITRNGYWTPPAPPIQFTTNENANYIIASNIPVGPPNVIARGIAFTEAGQEGQPGASYYTIPTPVSFVYNKVTYLSSSLIINDNTTTSAKFTFTDGVLLDAEEIDIQGNDLFSLGELGDSAWCCQYAGRSVWGRIRNKIQNFLNMTFDGGYIPSGGNLTPLGWGIDTLLNTDTGQQTLNVSPVFGNSYYISNQTGASAAVLGMIIQDAYEDWNNVAILQNQVAYSVRVTCRTPSSATTGALVIDLTEYNSGSGYGQTYGTYTLPCSSMTSNFVTYSGTLLVSSTFNIPSNLYLRLWAQNLAAGGNIEIDRIEVYPTEAPTNYTQLAISYENDWESFDQTTGGVDTTSVNAQPANGAFIMDSKLYVVKESSLGYISDTPGQEPANWNPFRQISNVAGASGINAWDALTERWAIFGNENGLYIFAAGAPSPIQIEIPDIWNAINWKAGGQSVVIRNDAAHRRVFIAAPMTTPNQWCPDFPENTNPTTPNVIIYMSYAGIKGFDQLEDANSMHVTMMGKLAVHDFRRKWSLWSIQTPYMAICKRSELSSEMMFCNGIGSSKIYHLGAYTLGADDGISFPQSYCTYGFVSQEKAEANPLFGDYAKRWASWQAVISGNGNAGLTFYQNVLTAPYPFVVPGGVTLTSPAANDLWGPLDEYSVRIFAEVTMNTVGSWFSLSRLTLNGRADAWSPIRGF